MNDESKRDEMQAREALQASEGRRREASVFISSLVLCIDSKVGINMLETFDVDFDGVTETPRARSQERLS